MRKISLIEVIKLIDISKVKTPKICQESSNAIIEDFLLDFSKISIALV